jgi:polysaccharide biosynthesis PFTS motif protein
MIQHKLNEKIEIVKAYDYAKESSLISKIHELKKELYFTEIKIYFFKYIYSTNYQNVNFLVTQTLNLLLLNVDFNKKVLLSLYNKKKFSHPLPSLYINILKYNNLNINKTKSFLFYILFIYEVFLSALFNHLIILKQILLNTKPILSKNKAVFFADIQEGCIPFNSNNIYNIINWYINNNVNNDISEIRHNVNSKSDLIKDRFTIKSEIPISYYLQNFNEKLKFISWSFIAFIYNLFCLFTFKFSNILIYNQSIEARIYQIINKRYLPKEIYFSISSFALKPLWTYVVEEKGTIVSNYSYASSFQGFKTDNTYIDQEYFFENTKWKHIFQWSLNYYNYIKSRVPQNVSVHLVNPIYYSDSNFFLEKSSNIFVGVFDVTPLESDISCTYLPETRYRTTQNSILFLNDIYEAAISNNYILLWKRKRKFNSIHSNEYIKFCLEFEKRKNVIVVDSEASAFKVIQYCNICISVPFTSTALIAEYYKIKSIYYDPTNLLYLNDRGAQGIPLIQNKNNLLNFMKNV